VDGMKDAAPYIADALVVLGVFIMTAGVYGLARMPDIYTKIHAASKAVFLGAIALMAASFVTGEPDIIFRVILIAAALIVTTPIATHAIAKAAAERGEAMRTPGATNESTYDLTETEATILEPKGAARLRDFLGE